MAQGGGSASFELDIKWHGDGERNQDFRNGSALIDHERVLVLGIDGGGTKCWARLRDAGGILLGEGWLDGPISGLIPTGSGARFSPPAAKRLRRPSWTNDLRASMRESVRPASAEDQRSSVFCRGPHPFASFSIDTDAHTAWLGRFGGGDGAILIIGTGSCGYGGVGGGAIMSVWGYEVSDEGSGPPSGAMCCVEPYGPMTADVARRPRDSQ